MSIVHKSAFLFAPLVLAVSYSCGSPAPVPAPHPVASASVAAPHPSASASASASASVAIKPPSTGKEFVPPKITPPTKDAARKMLATALAAAQKKDCPGATNGLAQTGFNFAEVDAAYAKDNQAAFLEMARCAEAARLYRFMGGIAGDLTKADPKFHPELLARALLGLGNFTMASDILKEAAKAAPTDGDIAVTIAKVACKQEAWAECLKDADATLKLVGTLATPEKKEIAWRAQKYRARSFLYMGKFPEASKAADEAEKLGAPVSELDEVKKLGSSGERHKMLVEATLSSSVPIGGYHLFGKVKELGSVASLKITNFDSKDQEVKVEAEISGLTEHTVRTITVLKGKSEVVALDPPLRPTFDVRTVRADMPSQLALKVTKTDGADVAYEQALSITLLPRDSLPLQRVMQDGQVKLTPQFVGAWITPNAKAVDEFLAAAKKRLPPGQSFSGGQSQTMPQVKAIYDELHERGMSYVMDPDLFVEGELVQRTRLPGDVLSSTNAQCIEGAILYATLLEAIGLHPFVTLAKGHSWAGWRPEGHDAPPARAPKLFWLETTVTHSATFDQALAVGDRMFYDVHGADWTAPPRGNPGYGWIDVVGLRAQGVTSQPWDL